MCLEHGEWCPDDERARAVPSLVILIALARPGRVEIHSIRIVGCVHWCIDTEHSLLPSEVSAGRE